MEGRAEGRAEGQGNGRTLDRGREARSLNHPLPRPVSSRPLSDDPRAPLPVALSRAAVPGIVAFAARLR